jgi:F-type H+-transporting ATPase subunit b
VRRAAIFLICLLVALSGAFAQDHGSEPAHGKAAEHGAAAEHEGGSHGGDNVTLWKAANFAILALALGYLIAKNAGPYFASRSLEIRKGIEDSTRLAKEAQANAAAIDARLANLSSEIESMRGAARQEAAAEGDRLRKETERELAKINANAGQEIASALKAAQLELKAYSARLAVDLARQKVRERITPADQDALVQNFVSDLEAKLEPR